MLLVTRAVVVGVFSDNGSEDLREVHGTPLLRLTMRRVNESGFPQAALIPWTSELDHVEAEVRSWRAGYMIRRTHHMPAVAMRDLVADLGAAIGLLVFAVCGVIDASELRLAAAILERDPAREVYRSSRVHGHRAATWLAHDVDEWPTVAQRELQRFYAGPEELGLDARMLLERARQRER